MTTPAAATCPRCSAPASGNYCANCGAPLPGAACSACNSALTPGANFCHRCGAPTQPAGAAAVAAAAAAAEPRGFAAGLPWGIGIVAFVALVALVVGQRYGARAEGAAGTGGGPGTVASAGPIPPMGGRAPDISAMTPEEQAVRLHDRVMALAERGQTDSIPFFAPMAIAAYQRLDSLTADHRYDLGSVAQVAGDQEMAWAQADTILARSPNHLLGLMLAIRAARATGDAPRAASLERRLVAAAPAERQRSLPEYRMHEREIEAALAAARRR